MVAELTEGEGLTNVAAAEVLGVAESTIREDKRASQNRDPDEDDQIGLVAQDSQNREPPPEPETPPLPQGRFRIWEVILTSENYVVEEIGPLTALRRFEGRVPRWVSPFQEQAKQHQPSSAHCKYRSPLQRGQAFSLHPL